jgi:hypothetical protein
LAGGRWPVRLVAVAREFIGRLSMARLSREFLLSEVALLRQEAGLEKVDLSKYSDKGLAKARKKLIKGRTSTLEMVARCINEVR